MSTTANGMSTRDRTAAIPRSASAPVGRSDEARRARGYPISRWYLRPAAGRLAAVLTPSRVRPMHLTAAGFAVGCAAAAVLLWRPEWSPVAAVLVLAAWFFDRADGMLARRQQTASPLGAWVDANVDEALDVGLHVAVAAAAASQVASNGPWLVLAAFLAGKYLLMYGLTVEEHENKNGDRLAFSEPPECPATTDALGGTGILPVTAPKHWRDASATRPPSSKVMRCEGSLAESEPVPLFVRRIRSVYHLPGNADVRVHLLALALAGGWLVEELCLVAVYYNLRWIARYVLVARRLGGKR